MMMIKPGAVFLLDRFSSDENPDHIHIHTYFVVTSLHERNGRECVLFTNLSSCKGTGFDHDIILTAEDHPLISCDSYVVAHRLTSCRLDGMNSAISAGKISVHDVSLTSGVMNRIYEGLLLSDLSGFA